MIFNTVSYNMDSKCFEETTSNGKYGEISGTNAREAFKSEKVLPDWFMDKEIQEMIKQMTLKGGEVFHQIVQSE